MADRIRQQFQSLSTDLDRKFQPPPPTSKAIDAPWQISDEMKRRLKLPGSEFVEKRNRPQPVEPTAYIPEIIQDKSVGAIFSEAGPSREAVIQDLAKFFADLRSKVSWKGASVINADLAAEMVYDRIESGTRDWKILRKRTVNFGKLALKLFGELITELED